MKKRLLSFALIFFFALSGCGVESSAVQEDKSETIDINEEVNNDNLNGAIVYDLLPELNTGSYNSFTLQVDDKIISFENMEQLKDVAVKFDGYELTNKDGNPLKLDKQISRGDYVDVLVKNPNQPSGSENVVLKLTINTHTREPVSLEDGQVMHVLPNPDYVGTIYVAPGIPVTKNLCIKDDNMSTQNYSNLFEKYGIEKVYDESEVQPGQCGYYDNSDGTVFYYVICADKKNENLTDIDAIVDTLVYNFEYSIDKKTSHVYWVSISYSEYFKQVQW